MASCMRKMAKQSGSVVKNTLKLVHVWQNDGYQKEFFYEDGGNTKCPAECGKPETRTHFI